MIWRFQIFPVIGDTNGLSSCVSVLATSYLFIPDVSPHPLCPGLCIFASLTGLLPATGENCKDDFTRWSLVISGTNWWRYVSTIFLAIFCGDIPWNLGLKNRPYIYGRYLQWIGSWVIPKKRWCSPMLAMLTQHFSTVARPGSRCSRSGVVAGRR